MYRHNPYRVIRFSGGGGGSALKMASAAQGLFREEEEEEITGVTAPVPTSRVPPARSNQPSGLGGPQIRPSGFDHPGRRRSD